jgi:hypothetical protein
MGIFKGRKVDVEGTTKLSDLDFGLDDTSSSGESGVDLYSRVRDMSDEQIFDYLNSKTSLIRDTSLFTRVRLKTQAICYNRTQCDFVGVNNYADMSAEDRSRVICYALMSELEREVEDKKEI